MPNFSGSYPPSYHLLVLLLSVAAGIPASQAMVVVAGASLLMITLGLYAFVRILSGSRLAALIAVALVLGGPTQWGQILNDGLYPRLLGWGFVALALAAAATYGKSPSRRRYVMTVVALAAAASCHPLSALLGGVLVAGVIVLISPERRGRILRVAAVGAGTVGLAGYFYLPILLAGRSQAFFTTGLEPIRWSTLLWPSDPLHRLAAFSPALGVVVLLSAATALRLWRRLPPTGPLRWLRSASPPDRSQATPVRPALLVTALLAVTALGVLAYCVAGHFETHFKYYIAGLDPWTLLTYPEWLLAAATGTVAGLALRAKGALRWSRLSVAGAAAGATVALALTVPMLPARALDYQNPGRIGLEAMVASNLPDQQQLRVVSDDVNTFEPLNTVTTTPQTEGYQMEGQLNPSWQYWLEQATSVPTWNANDRRFLLDWYAVGWVLTGPGAAAVIPYASDPAHFSELNADTTYFPVYLYGVNDPQPIASASDAPTVLFIGDSSHYQTFMRALAEGDIGSSQLVPIYGGEYVDDVGAAELAQSSTVFLYGARSHHPAAAGSRLRTYVQDGGRLVVDAGDQGANPPLTTAPGGILPVAKTAVSVIQQAWRFTSQPDPAVDSAALKAFAPPEYGGSGGWQVNEAVQLQPGSRALVAAQGQVLVASRALGAGEVYWSGLNLPYHDSVFKNAAESSFLGQLLGAAEHPTTAAATDLTANTDLAITAERVQGTISGRGLLVKESDDADWQATVNGHRAPVETAGPEMMYIPLPAGPPAHVVLSYHLSRAEVSGNVLSIVTALFLVAFVAGVPLPRRPRRWLEELRRLLGGVRLADTQESRAVIRSALLDPSPDIRVAAVQLLAYEPLGPFADVLAELTRHESNLRVIEALRHIVATHQWEPLVSADLEALRHWGAGLGPAGAAGSGPGEAGRTTPA